MEAPANKLPLLGGMNLNRLAGPVLILLILAMMILRLPPFLLDLLPQGHARRKLAEVLGLKPTDIISNIGNSSFPPGQPSGGSTTTPSMAPPCLDAVTKARDAMFKKIAPTVQATVEDLSLKNGQLYVKGEFVGGCGAIRRYESE